MHLWASKKTGNFSAQQTAMAYRRDTRDLRKSVKIFDRIIYSLHLRRRSGTTHLTSSSKVSQSLKTHEEPLIVVGSEVKQLKRNSQQIMLLPEGLELNT